MPDAATPRRPSQERPAVGWFVLLLVAATIAGTVGGPAIGRGVLHASDTLQLQTPWKADATHDFTAHNTSTSDTVDATVPVRVEWSRRARAGDLPLWTDLQAGGAPLVALPNASAFSPLSIAWYLLPAWYAPAATKLLEMAVAALFTFLFVRRLGAGRLAAGVAAVAFAGSGFQVVWTNWPHTHVAALVPALLWAVDRAQARGRPVDLVPVALVSAGMWFEGFPAITLWAHLAAGLYALVRALPSRIRTHFLGPGPRKRARIRGAGGGTLALPLAGAVLGAVLAAVQLLPFAFRLGELDLAYRQEKVGALPWRMIATMVVPDAFGNPAEKVFYGFRNYVEINAFAGAAVVVLAVAGLVLGRASAVPRRVRWFVAGAIAVCIALIFVGGPPLAAFQRIPVIGPNSIGRLRSLLALFVAVQAGVGVDALVRGETDRRRVVLLAVALAVVAVAAAVLLGSVAATAEAVGQRDYLQRQLVLPGIAAAVAVVLVLLAAAARRDAGRLVLVAGVAVVVAVEAVTFARSFLPRIDRDLFYPATPTHDFLAAELGADRFAAAGFAMVPGTNLVYGLRSATAHTLTPASYADLLTTLGPEVFERNRTYPVLPETPALATSPLLDRMGVRYVVTDPEVPVNGATEVVTATASQAHLRAGDDLEVEVEVPAGPLRAVRLDLGGPVAPAAVTHVVVDVLDADGEVLATGRRRVLRRTPAGPFDVALDRRPAVDAPGPWRVRVGVEADAGGIVLGTAAPDTPAVSLVRPVDDGLELVFTDGSVVYRRDRALPRIRWAGRSVVEPDPAARVDLLAGGDLDEDVVVLSAPADAEEGDDGAGIAVVDAGGDAIRVDIDAPGPGYLVVADTIQEGWVAEVDGEPAPLLDADHAFVAVPVAAGEHRVELHYAPRGWRSGLVLTALAAAALVALVAWGRGRERTGPGRTTPGPVP